ncbi:MAG: hypothetical protein J6B53_14935 [Clostridia bacterium]|jgi:hypothetical protein|nr:hypothetical protein [Clostridia bacterium]
MDGYKYPWMDRLPVMVSPGFFTPPRAAIAPAAVDAPVPPFSISSGSDSFSGHPNVSDVNYVHLKMTL